MPAFLRLVLLFGVILATLYHALALASRLKHRARLRRRLLELDVHEDPAEFLREGMRHYERSWRHKLLHLVYAMPPSVVLLVIYIINFT